MSARHYTRTGMLVLSITIILFLLNNSALIKSKLFVLFAKYIYMICFVFSFLGMLLFSFSNKMLIFFNTLLSGRFGFSYRVFSQYGVKLFGQAIEYSSTLDARRNGELAVVVDNSYIYFLVSYGVIFTIVFLILITFEEKKLLNQSKMELALPIFSYALYSITEKPFASINNHFIVLLLANAIVTIRIIRKKGPQRVAASKK